jgi:hypothetical protein
MELRRRKSDSSRMISLKRIQMERYSEEHFQQKKENVGVLRLHSKSHLFGFFIVVCQFAMFDTIYFIPAGIILYTVGITLALEQLTTPGGIILPWEADEEATQRRYEDEEFRRHYERAMFEYHVLKGKPNMKIVPIRQEGRLVLYAI